ncbi:protein KASH5 [Pezoporus flaviventris]|uniref:protein KASH5 n=1 Tax=Pezoporus flaviventris TaxID=889875 RepID=UPI002AB28AD0|nr:protein KASH5 [Pezoporus flaviventris]
MAEPPPPSPRSRSRSRPRAGAAGEGGGGAGLEFVIERTFEACDPHGTGRVPAARVLQFVAAVTGRSAGEGRLRALGAMLEAAGTGTGTTGSGSDAGLERGAFHSVMGRWVRECRRAPPSPEPLQLLSRAQLLATHNRRLQREAEASEEQNSRLGEELQELRGQLRSTQQALERARAATEELEDTKAVVKGLEEQNLELRRRMRALEKEQSSLRSHADGLQEEAQLCRCSELLLSHEATAAQAGQRVAELTTALEEYETAVREQRLEAAQLQHQLNQLQETWGL